MTPADKKAVSLLTLLVLVTCLPFVRRAYFVDDYYQVTMACGILEHPLRPYDFLSDDAGHGNIGWQRGQPPRMVNPPLHHYFLAAVMKLWGSESWKLRTAALVFPILSVVAAYFLGKRLTRRPFAAAVLMAITPAFWLTSYSLLMDGTMLAFLLAALWVFFEALDRHSVFLSGLAGLLMGMAILSKYTGVLVVPLCLAWQSLEIRRRRWMPGYLAYAVLAGVMLLWGWWGIVTYGQPHFLAALPRGMQAASWAGWGRKSFLLSSFIGGGMIFVGASPVLLWRLSKAWLGGLILIGGALFLILHSRMGGFDVAQSLLLSVFVTTAWGYLVAVARGLSPVANLRHRFICLWMFFGLLELVTVMPWTAGRYLLLVIPPFSWGFMILADDMGAHTLRRVVLLITLSVTALVSYADYAQANVLIQLAQALSNNQLEIQKLATGPQRRWFYLGDTFDGNQAYLSSLGWVDAFPSQEWKSGDLLLKPRYRQSAWWRLDQPERFRPVMSFEFTSRLPVRVMDVPASAGFYASVWGALPFTITEDPLERFDLYQVQ